MKKSILFALFMFSSMLVFSQEKQLPEGWDIIILEGKPAYMNLINGEVTYKFPRKAARKPEKIVEYDPTITHVVKKGETLSAIARKYNLNLAKLYQLNSMESFDDIKIGQKIVVGYNKNEENTTVSENEKDLSSSANYHTVKSGDTLYSISKKYGISVAAIKATNNLSSNTIHIGQKLAIE